MWTAVGLSCTAIGCFLMAIPHLMSDSGDTEGQGGGGPGFEAPEDAGLCGSDYHPGSLESSCDGDGNRRVDWAGLIFIFLGIVLTGVGNCCFYTFGVAYLDDNTSHENSPIMLSITYTFRFCV